MSVPFASRAMAASTATRSGHYWKRTRRCRHGDSQRLLGHGPAPPTPSKTVALRHALQLSLPESMRSINAYTKAASRPAWSHEPTRCTCRCATGRPKFHSYAPGAKPAGQHELPRLARQYCHERVPPRERAGHGVVLSAHPTSLEIGHHGSMTQGRRRGKQFAGEALPGRT